MPIRPIEADDFDVIARIYALSKLDELRFEHQEFELLPLEQDPKRLAELMESRIYVYDDKGIRGYGAVHGAEIRALFVHPQARGMSIGARLLEHLLLETQGPPRLYVAKTNAPAKNLYRRYGFRVTKEFETTYNGRPVLANEMMRTEPSAC